MLCLQWLEVRRSPTAPTLLLVISGHVRRQRAATYASKERKIHTKLLMASPGHAGHAL